MTWPFTVLTECIYLCCVYKCPIWPFNTSPLFCRFKVRYILFRANTQLCFFILTLQISHLTSLNRIIKCYFVKKTYFSLSATCHLLTELSYKVLLYKAKKNTWYLIYFTFRFEIGDHDYLLLWVRAMSWLPAEPFSRALSSICNASS